MDKKEKIIKLNKQLEKLNKQYQHILKEFSATREGSSYGVEYYDIQLRVLTTMIEETKLEIVKLKKTTDN
ncbi:MAG: hypothetical protein WC895_00930 [Candidatus Shapirobacteria bacterium]|jgi:uncharacterized protein involved in exopolysaccharide biosynthesis